MIMKFIPVNISQNNVTSKFDSDDILTVYDNMDFFQTFAVFVLDSELKFLKAGNVCILFFRMDYGLHIALRNLLPDYFIFKFFDVFWKKIHERCGIICTI